MPKNEPAERRGHCHGLTLHFSEDDRAALLRSTLSAPELHDEKGQLITTAITARCGHDYRWSRGVRAFSVLILEQLLWHQLPETNLQADHQWRLTLFNILQKNSVMSSTEWISKICGYQGDGRSYLGRLFTNRGSLKNPAPIWNDKTISLSRIHIFQGENEITVISEDLVALFETFNQNPESKGAGAPHTRLDSEGTNGGKRGGIPPSRFRLS